MHAGLKFLDLARFLVEMPGALGMSTKIEAEPAVGGTVIIYRARLDPVR